MGWELWKNQRRESYGQSLAMYFVLVRIRLGSSAPLMNTRTCSHDFWTGFLTRRCWPDTVVVLPLPQRGQCLPRSSMRPNIETPGRILFLFRLCWVRRPQGPQRGIAAASTGRILPRCPSFCLRHLPVRPRMAKRANSRIADFGATGGGN